MPDPNCIVSPLECAGDAIADSAMGNLAEGLRSGAQELIEKSVGWWMTTDPIDLASSPAVDIREWTVYIAMALAVGSMMWALAQAAYRRRSEGLWDAGGGLLRLTIVAGMTGAGGFIMPQILMDMADSFAEYVIDEAVTDRIVAMTTMAGITSKGLIIVLAIILLVVGFVQALLMFLREGAVVILSGLLVLAAAGGMTPLTKGWWPKLTGTLLALIWYRAAAALVWGTAISFFDGIGTSDDPIQSFFIGIALFIASLFALGAMTKFFSWGVSSAAGGGGGLMAAAGMGAYALSQRGGGGAASGPSASQQSANLQSDMGGGGSGGGATIVGISGGSGSPSGAASSAVGAAGAAAAPVTGGASMAAAAVVQAGIQGAQAAKDKSVGAMTGGDV